MDQARHAKEAVTTEPPKTAPRDRLQDDWLAQEQGMGQDEETGSASGFGQTDGENGGNRG